MVASTSREYSAKYVARLNNSFFETPIQPDKSTKLGFKYLSYEKYKEAVASLFIEKTVIHPRIINPTQRVIFQVYGSCYGSFLRQNYKKYLDYYQIDNWTNYGSVSNSKLFKG